MVKSGVGMEQLYPFKAPLARNLLAQTCKESSCMESCMAAQQALSPSAHLDELLDNLVAQYGERHRPLFSDVLQCAYALGRDSLAYEATERVRAALTRLDSRQQSVM